MLTCTKCGEEMKDGTLLNHLRVYHQGETDLNVPCPACNKVFSTVPSIQKHWYALHHVSKKQKASASASEDQPTSGSIPVSSESFAGAEDSFVKRPRVDYVVSSGNVTEHSVSNEVECNVMVCDDENPLDVTESSKDFGGGASEIFTETAVSDTLNLREAGTSSATHMFECSGDENIAISSAEALIVNDGESEGTDGSDSSESEESDGEELEEGCVPVVQKCTSFSQTKNVNEDASMFLLHLKEKCNVPTKSTSALITQTETLIKGALQDFASIIDEKLKLNNLSINDVVNVKETVESTTKSIFSNLRTKTQQERHFKEKLGVVDPARYPIGRVFRRVRRKHKSKMQTVIAQEEIIFVPVDRMIGKLVNHPDYERFSEEGALKGNSKVLDSYMKGEKWRTNPVLSQHPDALRFVLYYDDLEVCAPLKSKAGKHKLGAFYLFLDNIPLKYRSNLDLICLIGLVNANLVKGKNYGMDAALEHVVDILKKFEDGIILSNGKKMYGALIATIGDNLGSHQIGGFKEGFTAHRFCRFCSVTYEQAKTMIKEDLKLLRDEISHARQCEEVQTSRGKNDALSTEYGVNRDSLLNILKSYHVIRGLPPDIFRDILEGSLALTVKKFLHHHLYEVEAKERKFTLDWLNDAIRDFDYGYSEVTDKPSELKKDHIMDDTTASLHQSGCQMWLLACILPVILGPYIDLDDKYFLNLLDMLEITRIVFSPEISKWMVIYLEDLIELYLGNFISLYGALIPKQHFLTHYPSLILQLGPLIHFMCLRCEAKHKYFKKIVNLLGNYKHLPWTLTNRHQLSQAVAWNKSLRKAPKVGPFSWMYVADVSYRSLLKSSVTKVLETEWLEFNGVKFVKEKMFYMCGLFRLYAHFCQNYEDIDPPHL